MTVRFGVNSDKLCLRANQRIDIDHNIINLTILSLSARGKTTLLKNKNKYEYGHSTGYGA